ncbi:hypothetical protein Tco_1179901 [Tanacetum coccineum]
MDNIIDATKNAYQELRNVVANTLEAKEASNGQEFRELVKLRIGSKCMMNEATGSAAGNQGKPFGLVKTYDMSFTVESALLEPTFGNKYIAEGEDI